MPNESQYFLKTRTKKTISAYQNYDVPQYLPKEEFLACENLPENKDIVIQESD